MLQSAGMEGREGGQRRRRRREEPAVISAVIQMSREQTQRLLYRTNNKM